MRRGSRKRLGIWIGKWASHRKLSGAWALSSQNIKRIWKSLTVNLALSLKRSKIDKSIQKCWWLTGSMQVREVLKKLDSENSSLNCQKPLTSHFSAQNSYRSLWKAFGTATSKLFSFDASYLSLSTSSRLIFICSNMHLKVFRRTSGSLSQRSLSCDGSYYWLLCTSCSLS